jgi:hypothetical protein
MFDFPVKVEYLYHRLTKNQSMTSELIKEVASRYSLSESELVERGIKAFLQDELHALNAELRTILTRHSVQSLDAFNQNIIHNPDDESDLLPDFQRADFLTSRIEETAAWIKSLNGNG